MEKLFRLIEFLITRRKNTLNSYRVSYILTFSVSYLLFVIMSYSAIIVNTEENIKSSFQLQSNNLLNAVNANIKNLYNIVSTMERDDKLRYYSSKENIAETITALKRYRFNAVLINNICVYYNNSLNMLTTGGVVDRNVWIDEVFSNDKNKKVFTELFEDSTKIRSFVISEEDNLYYCFPYNVKSFFVFIINKNEFMPVYNLNKETNLSYFFYDDNNLLMHSRDIINVGEIDINKFKNSQVSVGKTNKTKYVFSNSTSEDTGWKVVVVQKYSDLYKRLNNNKIFLFILLLFTYVFAIVYLLYISKKKYSPIENLVSKLNNETQATYGVVENDFELLEDAIDNFYIQNKNLKEQIEEQKEFAKDGVIYSILLGKKVSKNQLDFLDSIDFQMERSYFYVIVVKIFEVDNEKLINNYINIAKSAKELVNETVNIFTLIIETEKHLAIVVNIDKIDHIDKVNNLIVEKLSEYERYKVCTGTIYNKINKINSSYIEACALLDICKNNNETSIINYDTAIFQNELEWYPLKDKLKLIQSIKLGQKALANEILEQLINDTSINQQSFLIVKLICFEIINTIIKVISELEIEVSNDCVKQLMQFEDFKQLKFMLSDIINDACDKVDESNRNKNVKLAEDILEYVHKNYTKNDFSLESVAEYFDYSTVYISRIIRHSVGTTFINYVTDMKMEKAKKLLIDTKLPVKDIVLEIGYSDVSNFNRKFKSLEGISPLKYREFNT